VLKAIARPEALGGIPTIRVAPGFADRAEAGENLAARLARYQGRDVLVLGIPHGGVPVAAAVARALDGELDVVVARKLAAPISGELGIGAVTADGGQYLNREMIRALAVDSSYIDSIVTVQSEEASRVLARLRGSSTGPRIAGRTVILVDDGVATGATMTAAARYVQSRRPKRLIIAVPVAANEAWRALRKEADEIICLETPDPFWALSLFYRDFPDVADAEVLELLERARIRRRHDSSGPATEVAKVS
jgi:putative phosphoribosyl transferase